MLVGLKTDLLEITFPLKPTTTILREERIEEDKSVTKRHTAVPENEIELKGGLIDRQKIEDHRG